MKSKTEAYDNNYISNKNKTIFITNFYNENNYEFEGDELKDLTLCISFDDPITKGLGYACCDIAYNDLFNFCIFSAKYAAFYTFPYLVTAAP